MNTFTLFFSLKKPNQHQSTIVTTDIKLPFVNSPIWCLLVAIFVPLPLNYNFHLRIALFGALLLCSALRFQTKNIKL